MKKTLKYQRQVLIFSLVLSLILVVLLWNQVNNATFWVLICIMWSNNLAIAKSRNVDFREHEVNTIDLSKRIARQTLEAHLKTHHRQ